jgi:hypothetical protein
MEGLPFTPVPDHGVIPELHQQPVNDHSNLEPATAVGTAPSGTEPSAQGAEAHEPNLAEQPDGRQQGHEVPDAPSVQGSGVEGEEASAEVILPPPPMKKHRWGPPMNQQPEGAGADGQAPGDAAGEGGEKKRKRKSRWEKDDLATAMVLAGDGSNRSIVAVFPKEVMLSNGIKVRVRVTNLNARRAPCVACIT